jgi:hypothetical protein
MDAMKDKGRSDAIDLPPEVVSALTAESSVEIRNGHDGCKVYVDGMIVHAQLEPVSSEAVAAHVAKLREHAKRVEFTCGLHALADFLNDHPEVPVPPHKATIGARFYTLSPTDGLTPEQFLAAVDALDADLSTPVHAEMELQATGHFGPINYMVQVPRALIAEERDVVVKQFVLPDNLAARETRKAA